MDVLQRQEVLLAGAAEVEHRDDVRVDQHRLQPRLVDELAHRLAVARHVRVHPLDHEVAHESLGAVRGGDEDLGHPPLADPLEEVVAPEHRAAGAAPAAGLRAATAALARRGPAPPTPGARSDTVVGGRAAAATGASAQVERPHRGRRPATGLGSLPNGCVMTIGLSRSLLHRRPPPHQETSPPTSSKRPPNETTSSQRAARPVGGGAAVGRQERHQRQPAIERPGARRRAMSSTASTVSASCPTIAASAVSLAGTPAKASSLCPSERPTVGSRSRRRSSAAARGRTACRARPPPRFPAACPPARAPRPAGRAVCGHRHARSGAARRAPA